MPAAGRTEMAALPLRCAARSRRSRWAAGAGQSDADIAAKLSISPKTVGHHVAANLGTLGVDNRTQAAARVRPSKTTES